MIVDGKKLEFKLTLNAMCDFEEKTGITLDKIEDNMSMSILRILLSSGLKIDGEKVSNEEIGELITAENISDIVELINIKKKSKKK